jgi:hypothetical protein
MHYAECHYAECHYAECHYAECHYAECNYAECRRTKTTPNNNDHNITVRSLMILPSGCGWGVSGSCLGLGLGLV